MLRSNDSLDSLTSSGAHELAERIRDYWVKRGYPNVKTFVVPVLVGRGDIYCVRSNIVDGFPPSGQAT